MVEKAIFGSSSTPAALVIDLLRMYTTVVLAITASTKVLPILDTLPAEVCPFSQTDRGTAA